METTNMAYRELDLPGTSSPNPLTEFVVRSASKLVSGMLEAEVEEFLSSHSQLADGHGKPRVVRNGYLPERMVKTALGKVSVRIPRVRDRLKGPDCERIRFNSRIISPYQRRTNGRSNFINRFFTELNKGDVVEAAIALLGARRQVITPSMVNKLRETFKGVVCPSEKAEEKYFRSLWVDRISAETEPFTHSADLIVVIGETDQGEKNLVLVMEIDRETTQLSLYRVLSKKLSELGISGQPCVSLSERLVVSH